MLAQQGLLACDLMLKNFNFNYIEEIAITETECRLIQDRILKFKYEFELANKTQQQNQEKYIVDRTLLSLQVQQLRISSQIYGQVLIGKTLTSY